MSYFERLRALAKERDTMLCVGLDPDPERIAGGAAGALRHCREVVRQTHEHVCCYKPNSAFWEQYGPDGMKALLELRDEVPQTPFLFDGKRGDMGNTMRAYALTVFKTLGMDAGGRPLYSLVAELAERLNVHHNVGLVVGATAPTEIADVRRSSHLPFLIPGLGAQGGDLEGSVRAAWNGDPASCLVSASRSVLFAEKPGREAAMLKDQINAVVGALR